MADIIDADYAGYINHAGFNIHFCFNKVRLPAHDINLLHHPPIGHHPCRRIALGMRNNGILAHESAGHLA